MIQGTPSKMQNNELKCKVIDILRLLNVMIANIEDCHKMFVNLHFYQEALNNKFDLRRLNF